MERGTAVDFIERRCPYDWSRSAREYGFESKGDSRQK